MEQWARYHSNQDTAAKGALKSTALNKTEPERSRNSHRRNTEDACGNKSSREMLRGGHGKKGERVRRLSSRWGRQGRYLRGGNRSEAPKKQHNDEGSDPRASATDVGDRGRTQAQMRTVRCIWTALPVFKSRLHCVTKIMTWGLV